MSIRELALRYEQGRWRARGPGLDLEHRELRDLDALIAAACAEGCADVRVHVRFDLDALPLWLRQYQAHYFNYVLLVAPRGKRA